MAFIGLSTPTFDIIGAMIVRVTDDKTNGYDVKRRASRTATLDGGAFMNDSGYSASETTYNVGIDRISQDVAEYLQYLVKNYSSIIVSKENGVFLANPNRFLVRNGAGQLTLLISGDA